MPRAKVRPCSRLLMQSKIYRGLPSSSKLHAPEVVQINKMEKKSRRILEARRREREKLARIESYQTKQQQEELATVMGGGKQSRLGRFLDKAKAILNKEIW